MQAARHTGSHISRQAYGQASKQTYIEAGILASRHIRIQASKQTHIQAGKQAGRQSYNQADSLSTLTGRHTGK